MSEREVIEANAAKPAERKIQLRLEITQAKTPPMTAAQRRKLDSFRRELVRALNKLIEMIDDKRRSCRAKSEFKKFLKFLENYEKKAQRN